MSGSPTRMGAVEWVAERLVASAAATRMRRDARLDAIMNSPAAEGRSLVAFALALRGDLSDAEAVALLGTAPTGIATAREAQSWATAATAPFDESPADHPEPHEAPQ